MVRAFAVVLLASLFAAPSFARGKHNSGLNKDDPSTNFSQHFDDEVKYDRDHPSDGDAAPPPKKHHRSHKKKKAAATSDGDPQF